MQENKAKINSHIPNVNQTPSLIKSQSIKSSKPFDPI